MVIPDSVTEIGRGAFFQCYQEPDIFARPSKPATGLTSVTLPKGLVKAGSSGGNDYSYYYDEEENASFADCKLLKTVTIPEGVQVIGNNMFSGCEALTGIVIPNSVTSIGTGAFRGSGLVSLTLGTGITVIPLGTFSNCTSLQTIVIPEGIVKIDGHWSGESGNGGSFSGCTALTSVTLPSTIKALGAGAFRGCSALTAVTIPDSVEIISFYGGDNYYDGDNFGAFSDCPRLNLASQAALRRRGYTTERLPEDPEYYRVWH
ncbi:hypothetical protein FACS189493_2110 [Spirochaetia bacterium]|nr:hypothetical protein FACS189493_2110 [Spirochaetia bacterium]